MSLVILFGETGRSTNRREFVEEKLKAFFASGDNQDENADIVCSHNPAFLKVVENDDLPTLTEELQAELRKAKACFLKEVNGRWKAAEGETLSEDLITYSRSFNSPIPPGSPVLRRTTNLGTIYFVKPQSIFLEGAAKERKASVGVGVVSVTTDLLLSFAKGIAGAAGSSLVEKIFGAGSSIDTIQLCKELASIVKNANAEQTVQEQSGEINAVQNHLTVFYKNEKIAYPDNRRVLSGELKELRLRLGSALSILQEEDFKRKGISVFITGANVMLALLQEMALVDPLEPDFKKSASWLSYKDMLKAYTDYVGAMRTLTTEERTKQVSAITCKDECSYVPPGEVICTYHCRYKDAFKNKGYDFTDDSSKDSSGKKAREKAEESRNKLLKQLKAELNWMDDVVKEWTDALKQA